MSVGQSKVMKFLGFFFMAWSTSREDNTKFEMWLWTGLNLKSKGCEIRILKLFATKFDS